MYLIRVHDEFAAAHALRFAGGATERLHGHNWRVEAVVACPELDAQGIGIDFTEVHAALHDLLDTTLDHHNLHEIPALNAPNPTSERIAQWIYERLAAALPAGRGTLASVTVWETPECGVTYEP